MTQRPSDRCRCCGYRTGCATCPVCFWTEDGRPESAADQATGGPNGDLSLTEARLNFAIYGASHRRYQDLVRPPRDDERPPTGTIYRSASVPRQLRAEGLHPSASPVEPLG